MENKWIKTTDALPKGCGEVLAVVNGIYKNIQFKDAIQIAELIDEGWYISEFPEWENAEVSYWMPLPATPAEVENGDCDIDFSAILPDSGMRRELINHALDLINRQKAEIERLQKDCADIDNFARDICKERMLKGKPVADFEDLQKYIKKKRAEAIKEFAENVKKNHLAIFNTIYSHTHFCEMIDNLVKEMTEGKDGNV